jgi:hypothetical protein
MPTTRQAARSPGGPRWLFGLMLVIVTAALVACVYLPPWLELRELRRAHAAARQRIIDLEDRLTGVARQIEHARSDPAYLERLVREEFGTETPGVEMIRLETPEDPATRPVLPAGEATASGSGGAAGLVEQAAYRNPFVSVFVLDETRPIVAGMAGGLVLVALVLLFRSGASGRR